MIILFRGTYKSRNNAPQALALFAGMTVVKYGRKTLVLQMASRYSAEEYLVGKHMREQTIKSEMDLFDDVGIDAMLRRVETQRLDAKHFSSFCQELYAEPNMFDIASQTKKDDLEEELVSRKRDISNLLDQAKDVYDDIYILIDGKHEKIAELLNSLVDLSFVCVPQGNKEDFPANSENTRILVTNYDYRSAYDLKSMAKRYGVNEIAQMPFNVTFRDHCFSQNLIRFIMANDKVGPGDDNYDLVNAVCSTIEKIHDGAVMEIHEPMFERKTEAATAVVQEKNIYTGQNVRLETKTKGFFKKRQQTIVDFSEKEFTESDRQEMYDYLNSRLNALTDEDDVESKEISADKGPDTGTDGTKDTVPLSKKDRKKLRKAQKEVASKERKPWFKKQSSVPQPVVEAADPISDDDTENYDEFMESDPDEEADFTGEDFEAELEEETADDYADEESMADEEAFEGEEPDDLLEDETSTGEKIGEQIPEKESVQEDSDGYVEDVDEDDEEDDDGDGYDEGDEDGEEDLMPSADEETTEDAVPEKTEKPDPVEQEKLYASIRKYCEDRKYMLGEEDMKIIRSKSFVEQHFQEWKDAYVTALWDEFTKTPVKNGKTTENWGQFPAGSGIRMIQNWFSFNYGEDTMNRIPQFKEYHATKSSGTTAQKKETEAVKSTKKSTRSRSAGSSKRKREE